MVKKILFLLLIIFSFNTICATDTASITLHSGKNFVVFSQLNSPLDISQNSNIFSNQIISTIWYYNASDGSWSIYMPNLPDKGKSRGYKLITTIEPNEGYWIYTTSNIDALNINNDPNFNKIYYPTSYSNLNVTPEIKPSWNLVGFSHLGEDLIPINTF